MDHYHMHMAFHYFYRTEVGSIKKVNMKLKDMCWDERPRERMMEKGAASLSNVELLAILLRTGSGKMNVIETARALIKSADGKLNNITAMPLEKLCEIDGIGPNKAVTVATAFELGRRCYLETIVENRTSITNPKAVFNMMQPRLRGLDHEECWGIYLNRANYVLGQECFSKGGLDSTIIDIKTIVRKALEKKAASLIIVHNHPSGSAIPGERDIKETGRLKKALETCGMALTDHIIISEDAYYSFADEQINYLAW